VVVTLTLGTELSQSADSKQLKEVVVDFVNLVDFSVLPDPSTAI
jgi:hypothetical protein